MARERVVSRTINETTVKCLCMDLIKSEPVIKELKITGDVLTESELLKKVQKEYNSKDLMVCSIKETTTVQVLYAMKEIDFIKYAFVCDLETRKALEIEQE